MVPLTTSPSPSSIINSLSSSSWPQIFRTIASFPSLLQQEDQAAKTPFDVMVWTNYLIQSDALLDDEHQRQQQQTSHQPPQLIHEGSLGLKATTTTSSLHSVRFLVGQRACTLLPGSYKLWKNHLEYVMENQHLYPVKFLETAFEVALIRLHKYPTIWLLYLELVMTTTSSTTRDITALRHLINRCFMALPVPQHDKVWPVVLTFALQHLPSQHPAISMLLQAPSISASPFAQRLASTLAVVHASDEPTCVWELPSATVITLVKRYAQLHPLLATEGLAELYLEYQQYGQAALVYQDLLQPRANNQQASTMTSSRHEMWTKFCQLCTQHPQAILKVGIDFEGMIRSILPQQGRRPEPTSSSITSNTTVAPLVSSSEQEIEGTLWIYLAQYYLHQGELDMARTILGEALEQVQKVRDFSLVFEAYLQLEETILDTLAMNEEDDEEENEQGHDDHREPGTTRDKHGVDPDWDILLGDVMATPASATSQDLELELALARAEYITSRRPLLLNQVLLKQNPHNVGNWIHRAELLLQQQHQQAQEDSEAKQQANVGAATASLEEALRRVSARHAVNGQPSQLVLRLAALYENETLPKASGLEQARRLFRRICEQQEYMFHKVEDFAECYVAWVEMELRQEQWEDALSICRISLSPVSANSSTLDGPRIKLAKALTKSLRLWDLWLDLEESLGTVQTTKDAYYQSLEQKVATPLQVLNFATFLLEHNYFEEAFAIYERGIDLFAFPHASAKLLWKAYLQAFLKHFRGTKLARARDLWTRCLETCPPQECAEFYLMCGDFEEEYGLTQRALNVYHEMCQKVPTTAEKLTAFQLYIAKTTQYVGLTATRTIYQEAIAALAQDDEAAATKLCLEFTKMETSLLEVDRARAILVYGAQFADPRRRTEYWQAWNEFEILHGNEETFREMLRVRKSVEAMYSTINYNAAEMSASSTMANLTDEQALNMIASQEGVELPSGSTVSNAGPSTSAVQGFVKASSKRPALTEELGDVEERVAKLRKITAQVVSDGAEKMQATDDAEIDIDDVDDDEDDEEDGPPAAPPTAASSESNEVKGVTLKAIPEGVFGGLASAAESTETSADLGKMGALERLRAAAKSTAQSKSGGL